LKNLYKNKIRRVTTPHLRIEFLKKKGISSSKKVLNKERDLIKKSLNIKEI
jgi:hypothetical protein